MPIIQEQVEEDLRETDGYVSEDYEQAVKSQLVGFVRWRFQNAADDKENTERKWVQSYLAWRGEYSAEERNRIAEAQIRNEGASSAFIKITKTKVEAAKGLIRDIVFAGSKFPIEVAATPKPEGVPETVHLSTSALPEDDSIYGYDGDGSTIEPGTNTRTLLETFHQKVKGLIGNREVVEGESPDPNLNPEFNIAEEAARNMDKTIHDQLYECEAEEKVSRSIHEQVMLGTGCIKGPFTREKVLHNWTRDEYDQVLYTPSLKEIPDIQEVSVWNCYPDPEASTVKDLDFFIERHLLNKDKVFKLKEQPFFDHAAIDRLLETPAVYEEEEWEDILQDNKQENVRTRYEVLEYWGYLPTETAEQTGIIKKGSYDGLFVQVNIWTGGGEVLRAIPNPYIPQRIPYMLFPYEEHPYQIWGVGVPENMDDTQRIMNGHWRMSVDNLRLAGNVIFEVNQNQLVPGQDMSVYPGKIFLKQNGAPGQSLYGIKIPDVSQSHMLMFRQAQQIADEETGIPSYAHGQTGVLGTGRTAAGMSMLMSAAGLNIKTVVKNLDNYLFKPLGEGFFQWNMQFNHENMNIRGDLSIVAKGTKSLMQKEVKTQRLMSLIQVASNPIMAPFLNAREVFKEVAILLELDPEKVVNDVQVAKLYAEMLGAQQNALGQGSGGQPNPSSEQQNPLQDGTGGVGGISPTDPTGGGGGNIGVGTAPQTGESGHSASA